ncbi:MAG: hypothetical protein J0H00_12245 [Burkholderiales bacterium]|nr:hypothetical protein [Burkholderiales bacterium]OJX05300.1 MAG: hypothetical protein BGO72_13810 [Burkholderiales bacterium 70-64]
MTAAVESAWPELPFAAWRETFETLHMWMQIVGKTRLALAPMENHWWQVALYVTARGLTTSVIPCEARVFSVEFDFLDHRLRVCAADGATRTLALSARPVADFYAEYLGALRSMGIACRFPRPAPVEVETAIPFAEDRQHAAYDPVAAHRWWQILVQGDRVMKRFRGRFIGKASPVHFFWGSFDHASTRFSGRRAPRHPGGAPNCPDYVMEEAYSHECSSCGLWPGGAALGEPAFYAYCYPEPAGYARRTIGPAGARYDEALREFILPVSCVRGSADPDAAVLEFLQSTYEAGAELAHWDRAALERVRQEWP